MWKTIGQSEAITSLQKSIQHGNLAHAYLLVGPAHVGKTTLALDIAQALNCDDLNPPCDKCESCCRVSSGNHADITIVDFNYNINSTEARSRIKIGIDDIKDIERQANLSAYEGNC